MSNQQYQPDQGFTSQVGDDSYVSRQGQKIEVNLVVSDSERVQDPINEAMADSDAQLERDDKEAIDKSNVIKQHLRGAKPEQSYKEPGDKEGLLANDGTSRGAY
ncbi:hypothetical protein B0H63DRAFT_95435 [Podospora didyma]|uniref:Histone chaperone domain-containing protein n=1 Tax=Podospora didyma TaxID=330526 RepID=A0AAE0NWX5_9PEZI|nr:hypothetical protein B0H63DRAFT_95435 [Podospora didyma]